MPRYVFGPIFSKRLGRTLAIDPLSALGSPRVKVCNLNCLYCELGPTVKYQTKGLATKAARAIVAELKPALLKGENNLDGLLIISAGEPTLADDLNEIITAVKEKTTLPVAVMTNGTRLKKPEIRAALNQAAVVIGSYDAARPAVYERLCRPRSSPKGNEVIALWQSYREKAVNQLWLKITLLKGINDHKQDYRAMREALARIRPHRAYVDTLSPQSGHAYSVWPVSDREALQAIEDIGPPVESGDLFSAQQFVIPEVTETGPELLITKFLKSRPATFVDLSQATGLKAPKLTVLLNDLIKKNQVEKITRYKFTYYQLKPNH